MAVKRRSEPTSNEPQEWQEGQERAREARAVVAEQVAALLIDRDITGGAGALTMRLRQLGEHARRPYADPVLLRAAAMEVAVAAAAWVVAIDLDHPAAARAGSLVS